MSTEYRIMKYPLKVVLMTMAIVLFATHTQSSFKFRNIKCRLVDKDFCGFEYCYLKAVNRSFNYLSLKVNLFKVPINNISIRIALLKRANGYKPFLYNVTVDACKFMRSQKSSPIFQYYFGVIKDYSNINHTCPYNHDLIVDKLHNLHLDKQTNILPIPTGRYAIYSQWFAYGVLRAEVDVYADKDDSNT